MTITEQLMRETLDELEASVLSLGGQFKAPVLVDLDGIQVFRHEDKNDLLLSWLKCVRAVSSLNASMELLELGYVQEIGTLCRCIDEFCQDVMFLATPLGDGGTSEQQKRMVDEFFQEEFSDYQVALASTDRNRVPRTKVISGITRIKGQPVNPNDAQRIHEVLNSTFSGYVHGAYPHIMEMYGVNRSGGRYFTSGFLGTPRVAEWTEYLSNYLGRTMIVAEVVAKRCSDEVVLGKLRANRGKWESETGRGNDDPNKILRQMKKGPRKES
jgi:hypothetical protein